MITIPGFGDQDERNTHAARKSPGDVGYEAPAFEIQLAIATDEAKVENRVKRECE